MVNYRGGVSSMGVPLMGGGIPSTPGTIFFVNYTDGSDDYSTRALSTTHALKTVAEAYDRCTTNKDDMIVLIGDAAHVLTSMLTVAKNRVHFYGMDGTFGRPYGQNAKIDLGVTTAVTDLGVILNTGVRNSFHNIKFRNLNNLPECLYTFIDSGEYLLMTSCEIYNEMKLSTDGVSELVANGDSSYFENVTIGSLANQLSTGAYIKPCVVATRGTATSGTGVLRDNTFENCRFWRKGGHVNNCFVYAANATDIERDLTIRNSAFKNNLLSTAIPAVAVHAGAAQTQGLVAVDNCTFFNITAPTTQDVKIYVSGPLPITTAAVATYGVAIQT